MLRLVLTLLIAALPSFALAADTLAPTSLEETGRVVVPNNQAEITLSFAPIVRKAAPAVVNIYAARVVNTRVSPFMNDPFFEYMFGQRNEGMSRSRMEQALGSGVIVRPDGLVVTNRHVIKDARDIKVVLNDRREFPAEIVLVDDKTDLAVLRIEAATSFPTLPLADSDALEVGDLVLAIGNPFGVGQSVTSGIVSATARSAGGINDYGYFIQTDAAINPGNSGGALVDMRGKLVGINTAIFSRTGGSLGIGFAIPVTMVRTVIEAGASGQRIVRPWLGAVTEQVSAEVAASLGLERPQGVLVKSLRTGSPLQVAGVRVGDIITAVAGQKVDAPEGLTYLIGTLSVGSDTSLTILRRGGEQTLPVKLTSAPEIPPRETTIIKGANPYSGATVVNISPAVLDELGIEGEIDEGVMITAIARRSTAARLGFEVGDIPLLINSQPVASVADLKEAVGANPRLWRLRILRGNQIINTVIQN